MSFLEMLDCSTRTSSQGRGAVAFDHDCREGICGMCGVVINGQAARPASPGDHHLPAAHAQVRRRRRDHVEPWRATAFPVIKDLVVDRSAFDRIIQAGGFISVNTGRARRALGAGPEAEADKAFDAATCIGCGACVAACPNGSAMLFTSPRRSPTWRCCRRASPSAGADDGRPAGQAPNGDGRPARRRGLRRLHQHRRVRRGLVPQGEARPLSAPEEDRVDEERNGGLGGFLKETAIVVVGALIASTLLRLFLVQVFLIPSGSMESTLNINDRVAVQKVSAFQRGDVVVFRDDLEWLGNPDRFSLEPWQDALVFLGLMPDPSASHLIKRVLGTAGDRVICCDVDGRITVNGYALDETGYLYTDESGVQNAPSLYSFDVVVPAGRIFVMGDHREASADSRCHLSEDALGVRNSGRVSRPPTPSSVPPPFTVFPFERWRTFADPRCRSRASPRPRRHPPPTQPVVTGELPPC
jgi:signal peptidase I